MNNSTLKKRIVTCSDGTWNKPNVIEDGKPVRTNVQKLFDYILTIDKTGIHQVKYYDEGIGSEGNVFTRMFNGATGKGIDKNILDIYRFIVWNYEEGDEIFLFGFSRGAYTARSLAGLIRKCGLLKKNDLNLFAKAYGLYRNRDAGPDSALATGFRRENSFEVSKIKFIGVWDTVGALGIPLHAFQWINQKKYTFYDTTLSSIIENAYHAVAIDEKRKTFAPTLWKKSQNKAQRNFSQVLEQRWFAGVHSNVGGGYPDEGLADISLRWMIKKANDAGLALDESMINGDVREDVSGKLYENRTGIFALTPSQERIIERGSLIDDSVYQRMQSMQDYKPNNILKLSNNK